nr:MAG TPA: hypothetical protein [Caudoviricetes sp.]
MIFSSFRHLLIAPLFLFFPLFPLLFVSFDLFLLIQILNFLFYFLILKINSCIFNIPFSINFHFLRSTL